MSRRNDIMITKLAELPLVMEAPARERPRLMSQKLHLCCKIFDFEQERSTDKEREKDAKTQTLSDLMEYFDPEKKNMWPKGIAKELLHMVQSNIFRPLKQKPSGKQNEDEEVVIQDKAWPHLLPVYELLLRLVMSKEVDSATSKDFFSRRFMIQFLNLLHSEDQREREYLKTILHRIYGKSMNLRSFIRRSINDLFYTFVYEDEAFNGIAELLEILGSIINGFALPLKEEHQKFLKKTLLPLHSIAAIQPFHQPLAYCIIQFVDKDPKMAVPVINGLLRFWPVTATSKEVLFLSELEEVLENTEPDRFGEVVKPLATQIGRSMCSPHHAVATRAASLWNNTHIVSLVALHRVEILPILFAPLYHNCENHWNAAVKVHTYNVLKLFMEMDSLLFDQCSAKYTDAENRKRSEHWNRKGMWIRLEQRVAREAKTRPPPVPKAIK